MQTSGRIGSSEYRNRSGSSRSESIPNQIETDSAIHGEDLAPQEWGRGSSRWDGDVGGLGTAMTARGR
eukprot:3001615-Pyramimonas_sp.AAC.1